MNRKARLNYIHAMSTQVEHKKMYKAKKQWIVAGLSFLVATGLGVVGGQLTTHADITPSNPTVASASNKVASGSSNNVSQKSSTSTNSMNPSVATSSSIKPSVSSDGIQHRAEALHSQIVLNKVNNTSVNNSGSSAVSSSAIGKQTAPASSASAKFNVSASASGNVKHGLGAMRLNAQAQSTPQATDNNWIWTKDGYKSVNQFNDWINEPGNYWGFHYTYSPSAKATIINGGGSGSALNFMLSGNNNPRNYIRDAQSIKFDNVNTQNDPNMSYMFQYNPNIKSIDFGKHFDTTHVKYWTGMFEGCSNLVSIQFSPKFTPIGTTYDLSQMFADDTSLQTLTLPESFNTQNVNNMDYMFQNDRNLTNLTLPSTFDTSNVKSMNGMFQGAFKYTGSNTLTLPRAFNAKSVKQMGYMFSNTGLSYINLPSDFDTSNVNNMSGLFFCDMKLQSLKLPDSFNTQGANTMDKMFYGDRALKSLNLGNNFDTSNVNDMSNMFSDCFSLPTINLGSKFDTSNVSDMQHMFDSDYALQNLNLGNKFNTNGVKNMYMMFIRDGVHNPNGTNLNLGNEFTTQNTTNMSDMFQYANLHSITIPSTAKFNAKSQLGNSWYKVGSKSNQLEKDGNGNYITVPNAQRTNLMNSNNHTGTWVKNPSPQKVTNTVAFTDKNNNLVGKTTLNNVDLDSQYTLKQSQLPVGYTFANNDNTVTITNPENKVTVSVVKNNKSTTDKSNNLDVPVAPNQDTDTVDYQYKGQTLATQQFKGNDENATDAGNTTFDVTSKTKLDIPKGYQLVNTDNKFNFGSDNGKHTVQIKPTSNVVNVNYQYKNQAIGSHQFSGNDYQASQAKTTSDKPVKNVSDTVVDVNSNNDTGIPAGYHVQNKDNNFNYDGKTQNVAVVPNQATDTINYQLNGHTIGTQTFTGNNSQAANAKYSSNYKPVNVSDTTLTINSNNEATGLPVGYQLKPNSSNKVNNSFEFDGRPHDVAVEPTNQTATVNYVDKNGNIVGHTTINGKTGSDVTPSSDTTGYHATSKVNPYKFDPTNANNNPSDNITVAPNTLNGTALVHIYYKVGNTPSDTIDGGTQQVPLNDIQYGQSDVVSSTQYCPTDDGYQDNNSNWSIPVDSLIASGSQNYGLNVQGQQLIPALNHKFTYDATEAPNLVIRYDDTANNNNVINGATQNFTLSNLEKSYGVKPQDWVIGNTFTFGAKGTPNAIDVISAPSGYHLVNNAKGFDYQNGSETITLEPTTINTNKGKKSVVLMSMPMLTGNKAPNSQSNNNPAEPASNASNSSSAASISINSNELSSLAKDIGKDINVTVRPNVTNTTNTIDDTTLNSLASEVATNNQEISSLANKPTNTTSTTNVNYSYFDNLINNGVDKLTNAINKDFKANLHNVHAQRTHKVTVKRVRKHIKWIMIMKPVKLYNKATLVGTKSGVKTLKPNHEITLNVKDVYKVHNHYIFKINFRHHDYFITANHNYVRNSYLPLDRKVISRKVRVLNDVYGYRHKNHDVAKTYHKGFVGRIKNIVILGHYNMTRIQLTNGLWISANKNFIKLV